MKMMIKKILPIFALAAILTGCVVDADEESGTTNSSGGSSSSGSKFSAELALYIDLTNAKVSSDNENWSEITTTSTDFFNETVKVKYTETDAGTSTGVIRIDAVDSTENISVYLTGTQTSGGVKVQTSTSYEVGIYLDNVSITSTNYPCIDITKGGAASVFLTGENTLVDGRTYGYGYGSEYATTSKNPVTEGSDSKGTLYCKGDMTISGSGSLTITQSYKNCIASKSILTIESGEYVLTSTGKNGLFGDSGVIVDDGTITFTGTGSVVTGSSGSYRKANGIKADSDTTGSYVKINGGTINITANYGKGIAGNYVYISDGEINIAATGSTIEKKSITYYDADGVKYTETLNFAAEGIEGNALVQISGGTTIVSAPDDGINVSNTGGSLAISGGFVYVKAQGDGLDSNGNITVSGGVVVVSQTGGGNSPIDCGDSYKFTVSGSSATVFAMGSSDMFSESIPSSTSMPMIYSTSLGSASSSLGVDGIIALKSPQTYAAAILISNSLTSGSSYSFVKGGTLGGTLYNSDAGVYFPATVSGGTSVSATATTSSSSGGNSGPGSQGGNTPGGSNQPGNQGGFGGR